MSRATGPSCPPPLRHDRVLLAHGAGGRLTRELIDGIFAPAFGEVGREDSARVDTPGGGSLAFTTDAFVVSPLFFPGGDIGSLAVNGTVNDLAMVCARPRWLSASWVLEEGLPMATLATLAASMGEAARRAQVRIVAGDTKVVERGKADGVYITTSGVGEIIPLVAPSGPQAMVGDAVVVSGDIGRHGAAVLSAREGLGLGATVESDCAPLSGLVQDLLRALIPIRVLRDPTRGGLATCLVELAELTGVEMEIDEGAIPLHPAVRATCELLGLDPLHLPSEGRMVLLVPAVSAEEALRVLHRSPLGEGAAVIGRVVALGPPDVNLRTTLGSLRRLEMLSGEMLPRIC